MALSKQKGPSSLWGLRAVDQEIFNLDGFVDQTNPVRDIDDLLQRFTVVFLWERTGRESQKWPDLSYSSGRGKARMFS